MAQHVDLRVGLTETADAALPCSLSVHLEKPTFHASTRPLQNGALWLLLLLRFLLGWNLLLATVKAGEAGRHAHRLPEAQHPSSLTEIDKRAQLHLHHQLARLACLLQGQDIQQVETRLDRLDTLRASQGDVGAAPEGQGGPGRHLLLGVVGPEEELLLSEGDPGTDRARSDEEGSERQLVDRTVGILDSLGRFGGGG